MKIFLLYQLIQTTFHLYSFKLYYVISENKFLTLLLCMKECGTMRNYTFPQNQRCDNLTHNE